MIRRDLYVDVIGESFRESELRPSDIAALPFKAVHDAGTGICDWCDDWMSYWDDIIYNPSEEVEITRAGAIALPFLYAAAGVGKYLSLGAAALGYAGMRATKAIAGGLENMALGKRDETNTWEVFLDLKEHRKELQDCYGR